jgi:hypothetical protein
MRFHPPDLSLSSNLKWLLLRAYGPVERPAPPPSDPSAIVAAARALDLGQRLVIRLGPDRLEEELGGPAARSLLYEYREAAARSVQLVALGGLVARLAAEVSIPLVFLKLAALELGGWVAPTARGGGDVDVLVPARQARRLFDHLIERGFTPMDHADEEHQLRPLFHPCGATVEVHHRILGLRLEAGRSADHDALERLGALRSLPGGTASAPSREVLVAHALVHGIAQHGLAPHAYPMMRMIGDLDALGAAGPHGPRITESIRPWLARELSDGEIAEAVALTRALAAGDERVLDERHAAGNRLLRHIVSGALDPAYAESLRNQQLFGALSDRGRARTLVGSVLRALWPTRFEMSVLYGSPCSIWGRAARRIGRPFDLASRLCRRGLRMRAGRAA